MTPATTELVDPLAASRHPFEVYLLALAAVSGVPLLFGQSNSDAVHAALPPLVVNVWGAMLVFGSCLALLGLFWRGHSGTGLLMERSGLVGVGGAAMVYAAIVVGTVGTGGLFSSCITAGFGAACFAQAHRISERIHLVIRQAEGGL